MKATYHRYTLEFKRPSGTSRGIMNTKETWFLVLQNNGRTGVGECGIFRGLSFDDRPDYEEKLQWLCQNIHLPELELLHYLREFPSIQFGLEQAIRSLHAAENLVLFPGEFTEGKKAIPINGLIWMGDPGFMLEQIEEKLDQGFDCIKMKIGAIDFDKEMALIRGIRKNFSKEQVELRVDANGAFGIGEAADKLRSLSEFDLHSIEQPIRAGQWQAMASLCKGTPLPIALDEELIGITDVTKKEELLQIVSPQYIILKPSLTGGFQGAGQWIELAEKYDIGWWITSALESNIGLNAIAQWTFTLNNGMPQGLGTGSLFTNNIPAPLEVRDGALHYNSSAAWDLNAVLKQIRNET
ncbi:o-succinylbenzoate synthase [Robertkochia aurantiaca]|uniref:o-succinylbenzoate synthase n=1 Tax=Robertkochia aurantiaca TaxID=2873700 RepID=UPI001CCBB77B|nr:o-succinylbenzoate synthase [Robertkochia sp. 3YJGBD-33]